MVLNEINQQQNTHYFFWCVPLNSNPFNIYIYFVFFLCFSGGNYSNFSTTKEKFYFHFCKMSELFNRIKLFCVLFNVSKETSGNYECFVGAVEGFAHLHLCINDTRVVKKVPLFHVLSIKLHFKV